MPVFGRDLPHHAGRGRAARPRPSTIDRTDFEAQVDRPDAGVLSWENVGARGRGAVAARRRRLAARGLSADSTGRSCRRRSLQLLRRQRGLRSAQLSLEFRGTVQFSTGPVGHRRGSASRSDRRARRSRARRTSGRDLPPVRSDRAALLRRLGPEADAADRRLPLQAQPRHLRPGLGRLSRADVRRRQRRGAVEAGASRTGASALELNYVWQRDFDGLGFGYYDYDVVMGHASLYWDTGWYGLEVQVDAGRYLAGDWGGTLHAHAAVRQRLGGRRLLHPDQRHRPRTSARAASTRASCSTIPFRWTTPFETRQDEQRRPAARSRATAAPSSTSPTGSIRRCATSTSGRLERSWGDFWQ